MAIRQPIQQVPLPEKVSWGDFLKNYFSWNQGEHVAVIGPTGSGKSVLMRAISWQRDWVSFFCTKKSDDTYNDFLRQGYARITKWPPKKPKRGVMEQRVLLWPHYKTIADIYKAGPIFHKAFDDIFIDQGWTLGLDDLFYLSTYLKLSKDITAFNYQVRSMGVTLIAGMQRPKKVPLETWDQASHVFLSRIRNYDDLLTVRGLAQVDGKTLVYWMGQLQKHEWLYLPVAKALDYPPVIVKPPLKKG